MTSPPADPLVPAEVPAALAEPTTNPTARWVALLTVASIGLWAGFFGPIQVLLAQQAEAIDPANKEQVLALVTGLGALVSVICNPVAGAFSDRTTLRLGRRLPWIIGGAVGGALSLAFLSVADSVTSMVLGWCGVQASLNAMLAAVTAMVPDQVPVSRRGRIGGIVAIAQTIGVVAGTGIAAATGSIAAGYLSTAAFLLLLAIPFCLDSHDLVLPAQWREPFDVRPLRPLLLDLAHGAPRLRVGVADPVPGQPRQRVGAALPPLLPAGRPRLHQQRGRGPGVRADRDVRRDPDADHGGVRHLERPDRAAQGLRDLVRPGRRIGCRAPRRRPVAGRSRSPPPW